VPRTNTSDLYLAYDIICVHIWQTPVCVRTYNSQSLCTAKCAYRRDAFPQELGLSDTVGRIVAAANDQASLDAMAKQTTCVLSTVGPYAKYGTPLVEVCANTGTHYVGERVQSADCQ
jgi:Saccharopine dehydrogenase NADP binding domain